MLQNIPKHRGTIGLLFRPKDCVRLGFPNLHEMSGIRLLLSTVAIHCVRFCIKVLFS